MSPSPLTPSRTNGLPRIVSASDRSSEAMSPAGAAPAGPEGEEDDLAPIVAQLERLAVDIRPDDLRCRLADGQVADLVQLGPGILGQFGPGGFGIRSSPAGSLANSLSVRSSAASAPSSGRRGPSR